MVPNSLSVHKKNVCVMKHLFVADYREKGSTLLELLSAMGYQPSFDRLDVADYVVSGGYAIERKSVHDLVSSILDGRLVDQITRMCEVYERRSLLVIGSLKEAEKLSPNTSLLYSSLAWTTLKGVAIVVFEEEKQAAEFLRWLIQKSSEAEKRGFEPLIRRRKPKSGRAELEVLNVLSSLPGVGPVTANRLLQEFGSLSAIFSASYSKLEAVVGAAKAKRLYNLFNLKKQQAKEKSLTDFL